LDGLRNDDKISSTIWRSYFSFFQGAKTANSKLFKAFGNAEKMEKNKQDGGSYFIIIPYPSSRKIM